MTLQCLSRKRLQHVPIAQPVLHKFHRVKLDLGAFALSSAVGQREEVAMSIAYESAPSIFVQPVLYHAFNLQFTSMMS